METQISIIDLFFTILYQLCSKILGMNEVQKIQIADFDYNLPDERIAKYPLADRDSSKILIAKEGKVTHKVFRELSEILPKDQLLVFNNTKVIHARLQFKKATGARIEVFCLEPVTPTDYSLVFQSKEKCVWKCIVGNAKKWKEGDLCMQVPDLNFDLRARKVKTADEGGFLIEFCWDKPDVSFGQILEKVGNIPIPPYLNRDSEEIDSKRYQTIYSKWEGSVAAPTAGLHFTPEVMESLGRSGISLLEITLHVGAGTFKPVKSDEIGGHDMHTEHFSFGLKALYEIREKVGNIIPVGTTSARSLESIYWLGIKVLDVPNLPQNDLFVPQWMPYEDRDLPTAEQALDALIEYMKHQQVDILQARTQIMIVPGYKFRFIKALITNFHQPKSTLLLLIGAILGEKWKTVYDYALKNDFRFLSYGDSSVLFLDS